MVLSFNNILQSELRIVKLIKGCLLILLLTRATMMVMISILRIILSNHWHYLYILNYSKFALEVKIEIIKLGVFATFASKTTRPYDPPHTPSHIYIDISSFYNNILD